MPEPVSSMLVRVAIEIARQRIENRNLSSFELAEVVWVKYLNEAVAILEVIQKPDEKMLWDGDAVVWQKMITVAISERAEINNSSQWSPALYSSHKLPRN